MKNNRIRVIIGHYGSGKTEFSVNYAIKLKEVFDKVTLADLDVVNPYFRSRQQEEMLTSKGITVIGSSIKGSGSDLPAVSGGVLGPLQSKDTQVVLDVGGDSAGARTLGRYEEYFTEGNYDMFCVVNANREQTSTVEGILRHVYAIEKTAKAKVTGIINNTHLLWDTTVEKVLKGQELCKEASEKLKVPIKYVAAIEEVAKKLPSDIEGEIFPIKMYMREKWM